MIGYTSWHQLLAHSCDSRLMSLFMLLSVILQFSHLSCYSVSYICSCSCYYLCTLFACTSSPLYIHTHQVAFWRPWICTSRYWTLCFYYAGVRWDCTLFEDLDSLPFYSGILTFSYSCFYIFLDSCISDSLSIPVLFIWYHAWMFKWDIAVICSDRWLLWFRFIACSG